MCTVRAEEGTATHLDQGGKEYKIKTIVGLFVCFNVVVPAGEEACTRGGETTLGPPSSRWATAGWFPSITAWKRNTL